MELNVNKAMKKTVSLVISEYSTSDIRFGSVILISKTDTMENENEQINKYYNGEKRKIICAKKQIIDTINVIMIFEYIHGIFRFSHVNEELRQPNWKMRAYTVLVISIYIILFGAYFTTQSIYSNHDSSYHVTTANQVHIIIIFVQYALCTVTVSFFVNINNIHIITTLANLDTMLQVEKFSKFYSQSRFETYKYMFIIFTSQFTASLLNMFTLRDIAWEIVCIPLKFVQKVEVLNFCKYIDLLRRRLVMINNYLKTFVDDEEQVDETVFTVRCRPAKTAERFNFIGHASESNSKIRDMAKMYYVIGQVCSMINEVFNFQILAILMSTFIFIIIIMWTCLYYYRTSIDDLGLLLNVILSSFISIGYVAMISIACERLLLVRKETKILVNKIIMNYNLPKTMRVQAKAFMELIETWPLRIHIYDMFSVDITLMLKFISVATTYLIVVIQIFNFF